MNPKSYVYRISNLITGHYYFGSRYANVREGRDAKDDLWYKYKTSSKLVKDQIKEFGVDAFLPEILTESDDFDETFWIEQDLIKRHIHDRMCLNLQFRNKELGHMVSHTAGKPKSEEHKRKISEAQKGKQKDGTPVIPKKLKTPEEKSARYRESAIKKFEKRDESEKRRIASLQSETLKRTHSRKTEEEKELTRLKKIQTFASHSPEKKAEINAKRSESAKKRWANHRSQKGETE